MLKILRNSILSLAVLVIFSASAFGVAASREEQGGDFLEIRVPPAVKPLRGPAHLSFVGDIMLDRGVKGKVDKYGNGDFRFLFENAEFLKEPDLMFANLEGPISDRGSNMGSIYSFRFDPSVLEALGESGIDVLSMANNHIGDWGIQALKDTILLARRGGFDPVGGGLDYEDARAPRVYEVNGLRIGYLGFSDFGPESVVQHIDKKDQAGVLSASDPHLPQIISAAKRAVDILVVSFHFGDEYKTESNDRQKMLARFAIDSGADIVAGHHPHVPEETERYKGGLIAYSLGNFIFDQDFSEETMRGMKLDVMVSESGIESWSTSTVMLNSNYQPSVVE